MDLQCFVRVLSELGGEPLGTGYLISRDRVLTAAHVVEGFDRVSIEHDPSEKSSKKVVEIAASVHWRGDEDCDIALLLLDQPSELDIAPPRLAETPIDTLTTWESRGWALISKDEPMVRDSMVDLHGDASAFDVAQKRSQLTIKVSPQKIDWWCGISGAPVFAQGGERQILGVVSVAPKTFKNVLYASPLAVAFHREDFLERIGPQVILERRDRLIATLKALLDQDPEEVRAITSWNDTWDARRQAGVEELARELFGADDLVVLLGELNKAHSNLHREEDEASRRAAGVIEKIVALIAPILVQRRVLHLLPNKTGGAMLVLPFESRTVSELAIAGFDGRASALKPVEKDVPDGVGRLPLPAEIGFDFDGKNGLAEYAVHFKETLLPGEAIQHVESLKKNVGEEAAREEIFRLADQEFEFQAEDPDFPLRRYLLYGDNDFGKFKAPFIEEMNQRLRSIHFVERRGGDYVADMRISL